MRTRKIKGKGKRRRRKCREKCFSFLQVLSFFFNFHLSIKDHDLLLSFFQVLSFFIKLPSFNQRFMISFFLIIYIFFPFPTSLGEAFVGRAQYRVTGRIKGRGHVEYIRHPHTNLHIKMKEVEKLPGERRVGRFGFTHKTMEGYEV